MKHTYMYVLAAALVALCLAGCNHPNNGEIPPASELPLPYPRHSQKPKTKAPPPMTPGATTASASAKAGSAAGASAKPAPSKPYKYNAAKGKKAYASTCSVCHKPSGKGIPGTFPPLKGNPVVTNPDATEQIMTVLHGAHGAKTILGVKYNGVMPPFGSQLSNVQIANLINYERSSWGNHAKHTTPKQVAKVRTGG